MSNDGIDKALDIKEDKVEKIEQSKLEIIEKPELDHSTRQKDTDKDYVQIRNNLKSIINTSETAVENLLNFALSSDNPRAYEVLSDLIKTTVDANMKLVELQKQMQEIKGESKSEEKGNVTNNAVFFGNTSDLLKLIKKQTKPEK